MAAVRVSYPSHLLGQRCYMKNEHTSTHQLGRRASRCKLWHCTVLIATSALSWSALFRTALVCLCPQLPRLSLPAVRTNTFKRRLCVKHVQPANDPTKEITQLAELIMQTAPLVLREVTVGPMMRVCYIHHPMLYKWLFFFTYGL